MCAGRTHGYAEYQSCIALISAPSAAKPEAEVRVAVSESTVRTLRSQLCAQLARDNADMRVHVEVLEDDEWMDRQRPLEERRRTVFSEVINLNCEE
jgi:hypothetical protein